MINNNSNNDSNKNIMEETDKMIIKILVKINRFIKECVVLSLYHATFQQFISLP